MLKFYDDTVEGLIVNNDAEEILLLFYIYYP